MSRSYKNTVIAILLACILTMAIGYAVLNTRLNISGTSKITSDFNIQVIGISELLTNQFGETKSMSFTPTSASYSANLQAPNDGVLYEIIIENKGNMAGYVEIKEGGFFNDYGIFDDGYISLGIIYISKIQSNPNDFSFNNEISSGINYLNPGEKLYLYAQAYFDGNATSLPEQKEYTNTVNFDFYSSSDVLVPGAHLVLMDSIFEKNPIITSGNGLYNTSAREYIFKSDGNSVVNNYVKIYDKMWRLIGFYDSQYDTDYYFLVEDDDTINTPQVFSTLADDSGYYNNLSSSTLSDYIESTITKLYIQPGYIWDNNEIAYVVDTELFKYSSSGNKTLLSIEDILNTSSDTNCSINTLSTGGCKSWLTTNGNTYLLNPIFESDKTTNTGNIAYLKDNKVIGVDPRDNNYGEYKAYMELSAECRYSVLYTNKDADGSKEKPYIIDTDDMANMPVC